MTETLWSSDGRHKVADVVVPPWKVPVEVYLWGSRVFVLRLEQGESRYCEARGVFMIPPAP